MFPKWTNEINQDNKLILTNDLDSLFSVAVLRKLFGCEIGMFYDFESIYSTQEKFDTGKVIGVDLAIEYKDIKTFCNHVTMMWKNDKPNPLSANLNNFAGIYGGKYLSNYTNKYSGSTLLMLLSYYDCFDMLLLDGHTELTEMQKMILVSIDSYFYGKHFNNGEQFYKWQSALGLEMFNDVLDKYSKQELIQFQEDYNLKGELYMDDGKVLTTLDLDFLNEHFPMLDFSIEEEFNHGYEFSDTVKSFYFTAVSKKDIEDKLKKDNKKIFSFATISTTQIKYTLI